MTVFDASALLAFLLGEPGADRVEERLVEGGAVGAANWSEVAQKVMEHGGEWPTARDVLLSFPLRIRPVDRGEAERAAELWTRGSGMSLADRLCLALGETARAEVLTADRAWSGRPDVVVIR